MLYFKINNRRYTGSKFKLLDWIKNTIEDETQKNDTFCDLFAGTGCVAEKFRNNKNLIINDFLFSNNIIYKAFFDSRNYNKKKIIGISTKYLEIKPSKVSSNYFDKNFGGKFFSLNDAKLIGFIREQIDTENCNISEKNILLASLLYSADKSANTVGHYDAFRKKIKIKDKFVFKLIEPIEHNSRIQIFREDANELVKRIKCDICYIDPPYNSRQYSRFYHVLENLTQWKKPKLFGEALKPKPENTSEYCKTKALEKFYELIKNINSKYIAVSYNNTYNSKSSSSKNKITLEQIESTLEKKGRTKIFKKKHNHFNAGKTDFDDHQEILFITKV